MLFPVTKFIYCVGPTLCRHLLAEDVIKIELMSVMFVFQEIPANEARLAMNHKIFKMMSSRHQRNTAGEHGFHGGAAPRFLEAMTQWIDKQIQTVQKIYLALLLGLKQVPTLIKFVPAVFVLKFVVSGHHPKSRVGQPETFIKDREIFRILKCIRAR